MENSEKTKEKKIFDKILLSTYILLSTIGLIISIYYNATLQVQVTRRDNIIQKLTFSDSLLHQILEIRYDSTSGTLSWQYVEKKGKVLKYNDLNSLLSESNKDYDSLYLEFHKLIQKINMQAEQNEKLNDSLSVIAAIFEILKSKYEINFPREIKGNTTYITIDAKKIDSAFLLLPYYRQKISFDPKLKIWKLNDYK